MRAMTPTTTPPVTPDEAWELLRTGNDRFATGRSIRPNQSLERLAQTAGSQQPFAAVLGCMDSRVAAEIVFDCGLGDIVVVRTAGHVVDSTVLGSLEFAVDVIGVPLIVVLGHENCGAVRAALAAYTTGEMPNGHVRDVIQRMTTSLISAKAKRPDAQLDAESLRDQHVRATVRLLTDTSPLLSNRLADGSCRIVGASYRLTDGRIEYLTRYRPA
jgi:carbonic anhydrase